MRLLRNRMAARCVRASMGVSTSRLLRSSRPTWFNRHTTVRAILFMSNLSKYTSVQVITSRFESSNFSTNRICKCSSHSTMHTTHKLEALMSTTTAGRSTSREAAILIRLLSIADNAWTTNILKHDLLSVIWVLPALLVRKKCPKYRLRLEPMEHRAEASREVNN